MVAMSYHLLGEIITIGGEWIGGDRIRIKCDN